MNQHFLQLYADFIVKVGVNVRPRQNFIVRCPVSMPDFAHACVRAGYEAGAKTVVVRWEDDKLTRLNMEMADEKDLTAMKPYELRSYLDYAEDPDGCCTLAIHAEDPEALAGLDAGKLNRVSLARRTFLKPWQEYTMNDRVQWCVAAVPAPSWAAKVFPELPVEEAVEKLWQVIFDVCRVSTGDPVTAWQEHVAKTKARRDQLNAWNLDHVHIVSSNGTDLTVGLADDATWEGASSKTDGGIEFIANVPTEEVFCAPHRERVNGTVYGTKPYVYNGQLIEGWHVTFKDGKVVEHGAEKNASLLRDIVEEVENPHTQVSLEDAQKVRKSYKVGQRMVTPLKTKEFGRIAAQTAKHVIRQGLREGERNLQCSEMQSRAHELITATVVSVDHERGNIVLDLGKGGSAVLPRNGQVPGESFNEGDTVQVYVVDVLATDRGPRVTISRTHPGLVKRMFELEVPEIYDGTVEIKAIAREAGARTKLAVWSKNPDVDPVGACIGARGARVEKIVQELNGEKIDVIRWSEDITEFISAALSPAKVVKVELLPGETKSCRVTVPDHQLSLAIGNKGQNVRLCAHLTGYNIDIRPESGYYGEDEE